MKLIPTIFAQSKKEFDEKFKKILPIAKNIQIDVMDGKFVKARSIPIKQIPNLKKYKNNFEAHLMCLHPEKYFTILKKKGFKKIFFHYESAKSPEKIVDKIKSLQLKAGIAFNPNASVKKILKLSAKADAILLMGHAPGKEHLAFQNSILKKIKLFRQENNRVAIQIDGGISPKIITKLAKLRVNAVNTGSYISASENPKKAMRAFR